MPTVTINGKNYETENLSEDARNQLASIQFADRKINELRAELAAMQTARNTYGRALMAKLGEEEDEEISVE